MASLTKNVSLDLLRLASVRDVRHLQKSASVARIWSALQVVVMLIAIGLAPFSVGALGRFLSRNPMAGSFEAVVEWSVFNS
jgi:hypothetical protein